MKHVASFSNCTRPSRTSHQKSRRGGIRFVWNTTCASLTGDAIGDLLRSMAAGRGSGNVRGSGKRADDVLVAHELPPVDFFGDVVGQEGVPGRGLDVTEDPLQGVLQREA